MPIIISGISDSPLQNSIPHFMPFGQEQKGIGLEGATSEYYKNLSKVTAVISYRWDVGAQHATPLRKKVSLLANTLLCQHRQGRMHRL